FDRMAGREVTFGMLTPRRPKRLPNVLSTEEVSRLLEAAPSRHDKLLLGLMYATGLRVSEVVRLSASDVDLSRGVLRVREGKGRKDRQVMLPKFLEPLIRDRQRSGDTPLFPGRQPGRHSSPRYAQRAMARAVLLAG